MLTELRGRLSTLLEERAAITAGAVEARRGLTEDETTKRSGLSDAIVALEEHITELEAREAREAAGAEHLRRSGQADGPQLPAGSTVTEPKVYQKGNQRQSFFKDTFLAKVQGDRDASERLARHSAQMADESRALGNTNTTGGSGGELAPPLWMVSDYIRLARAGRVTADLFMKSDVPVGVSSINLPRILTGSTTATQTTQNTALSQTDITTGSVSTGFATVGGSQLVSQQLLDQSAIDFDTVITADLAAAYAQNIGAQVLGGAGTGANNNSVVNGLDNATITNTAAVANLTAAGFYSKAAGLLASFATARFAPPTCWLMHPRRWYWLMAQVDTSNRPLVVPSAVAYNPMAANSDPAAVAGGVGTFLGLPVYIDPNMSTSFGVATNEDRVYLLKQDDLWLFESPTVAEVFREPYAGQLGVLFRLYAYVGTVLNRYPASIASLTGLTPPAF